MSTTQWIQRRSGAFAVALVLLYASGVGARFWLFARTPGLRSGFIEDYGLLIAFSACAAVGALLVSKRPENPLGWLLATVGLIVAILPGLESYAGYLMSTTGEPDALATLGAWFNGWYWLPLLSLVLVFIPLLFPDGHLPSRRWRWVTRIVTVSLLGAAVPSMFNETLSGQDVDYVIVNPIGIAGFNGWDESPAFVVLVLGLLLGILASIVSLAVRFRRSHGAERQQVKWLLLAVSPGFLLPLAEDVGVVGELLFLSNLAGVPVAIGVAVLRYRLYDVDRIISRTLGYVVVSAILAAIYVGGVLGLGGAARAFADGDSDVVVALSTLLVAAAFHPVRGRVQSVVDQRFNRARYDAQRTSEGFSQRLRDQVDLGELRGDLTSTVRAAVAPTTVGVWLPREAAP